MLGKATSHTQTMLQKTIEQKRSLEKVFATVSIGAVGLIIFKYNFLRLTTVMGVLFTVLSKGVLESLMVFPLDTYILKQIAT